MKHLLKSLVLVSVLAQAAFAEGINEPMEAAKTTAAHLPTTWEGWKQEAKQAPGATMWKAFKHNFKLGAKNFIITITAHSVVDAITKDKNMASGASNLVRVGLHLYYLRPLAFTTGAFFVGAYYRLCGNRK